MAIGALVWLIKISDGVEHCRRSVDRLESRVDSIDNFLRGPQPGRHDQTASNEPAP